MYIFLVSKVVVGVLSYALIFFRQRNARNLIKVKTLWTRKLNKVAVILGSMEDFHLVKDFNLNSTSTESLYQHIFNSKLNIFSYSVCHSFVRKQNSNYILVSFPVGREFKC